MKKTIALLAACLMAATAFVGCSNNANSSSAAAETTVAAEADADAEATTAAEADEETPDIAGVWVSTGYVTADGTAYSTAEYAEANGVDEDTVTVAYTFDGNGKATCTALGASVEGTYTFDGKKLETKFEGSAPVFEYDAEKDILANLDEASGVTSVMGRVKD